MVIKLPIDFAKKISEVLCIQEQGVDMLFDVFEDKAGYFVAKLKPGQFLEREKFRTMCALVRDLGGEGYLQGAKAFAVPGPFVKKSAGGPIGPTPSGQETDFLASHKAPGNTIPTAPQFTDLAFQGWAKIKGKSLSKKDAIDLGRYCIDNFMILPLFIPFQDDTFAVAGFVDMHRQESWCDLRIRNKLVYSDGTKAFPDWTESVVVEESNYIRRRIEEKLLQHHVFSKLVSEGWIVEERVGLKVGVVDLKASKGDEVMLIEVKPSAGTNEVNHALGQLLFYKEQVPNVKLAIALPAFPNDPCKEVLAKYAIEIIVCSVPNEKSKDEERAEKWKRTR